MTGSELGRGASAPCAGALYLRRQVLRAELPREAEKSQRLAPPRTQAFWEREMGRTDLGREGEAGITASQNLPQRASQLRKSGEGACVGLR